MRQLSDILQEKKLKLGSFAKIGSALGNISGQLIGKYASGTVAPLDLAIKWKEAFDENLIDLMFADDDSMRVNEPKSTYEQQNELIEAQRQLIKCMNEKEELAKALDELKKNLPDPKHRQLKPVKK